MCKYGLSACNLKQVTIKFNLNSGSINRLHPSCRLHVSVKPLLEDIHLPPLLPLRVVYSKCWCFDQVKNISSQDCFPVPPSLFGTRGFWLCPHGGTTRGMGAPIVLIFLPIPMSMSTSSIPLTILYICIRSPLLLHSSSVVKPSTFTLSSQLIDLSSNTIFVARLCTLSILLRCPFDNIFYTADANSISCRMNVGLSITTCRKLN